MYIFGKNLLKFVNIYCEQNVKKFSFSSIGIGFRLSWLEANSIQETFEQALI